MYKSKTLIGKVFLVFLLSAHAIVCHAQDFPSTTVPSVHAHDIHDALVSAAPDGVNVEAKATISAVTAALAPANQTVFARLLADEVELDADFFRKGYGLEGTAFLSNTRPNGQIIERGGAIFQLAADGHTGPLDGITLLLPSAQRVEALDFAESIATIPDINSGGTVQWVTLSYSMTFENPTDHSCMAILYGAAENPDGSDPDFKTLALFHVPKETTKFVSRQTFFDLRRISDQNAPATIYAVRLICENSPTRYLDDDELLRWRGYFN